MHQYFHLLVLLAFAATTLLLLLIARTTRQRLYAVLAVITLGIGIECIQHLVYGSPLEWWDMRDDVLAAAVAWLIGQWKALRRTRVAEA